jgi:hypothetical protein
MDRHRREVLFGSMSALAYTAFAGKVLGQEPNNAEVTATIKKGEPKILLTKPHRFKVGTSDIIVFKDLTPPSLHYLMPNGIEVFTLSNFVVAIIQVTKWTAHNYYNYYKCWF